MFQLLTPSAIRLQQRDGSATPDDAEDDVVTPAYAGTPACAGAGAEEMSSLDVVLSSEDLHAADAAAAFLRVVDPLAPCPEFPPPNYVGQSLFKFELDPFQKHAVCAIAAGHNVLVTAKTGASCRVHVILRRVALRCVPSASFGACLIQCHYVARVQ